MIMNQISLFNAKNKLSALVQEVEQGGEVTITRRGKAVAKLVQISPPAQPGEAVQRLRALRARIAEHGEALSLDELKALRDEGRR